jgi:hypothetical protein
VVFALFHGYFDHGQFDVEQREWSSSKQLAVVARRSDHEALSGDQFFVLVGDHTFSAHDLRQAYYNNGIVFRASSNCLIIHWIDVHKLLVTCSDRSIAADQIAVQRDQVGNVEILYEGIPHLPKLN